MFEPLDKDFRAVLVLIDRLAGARITMARYWVQNSLIFLDIFREVRRNPANSVFTRVG